jgi:TonB family protein
MKNLLLTACLLIITITNLAAQTVLKERYFEDENLKNEVPKKKANYSETISINIDSSKTREVKNLQNGEVISSQTFKGNEPYGIWKYQAEGSGIKVMDYNFRLVYSDSICQDSISNQINDYFENNESIGYIAPAISSGETNVYMFITKKTIYPERALKNNIKGTVYLKFRITSSGRIENISVKKGVNTDLDKEAVRVIRLLRLSSPPSIKGKPVNICATLPFTFSLD